MFKHLVKWILPSLMIPILIVQTQHDTLATVLPRVDNFAFIENQLLQSSRYTQTDETDAHTLQRFRQDFFLRYTEQQLETLGFNLMLENSHYKVYFEADSFSLILEDKASGYMYSSRPEFQAYTQLDNNATRRLMNSGLWVDRILTDTITSSGIKTESLYTLADVKFLHFDDQDPNNIDLTLPYITQNNSYNRQRVNVTVTPISDVLFSTEISLLTLGFRFTVEIGLEENGFFVHFDPKTILEEDDRYRMLGVQFFPYFGSALENAYPGYMVIPDGVGAMIRTNKRYDTSFQSDYYGSDLGYLKTSIAELSLPLYGMIHDVNRHGFFTEILSGEEHATLLANFWGRSTNYHRITNRYNVRRIYRNIINRAGDGSDVIPPEINPVPYQARYNVLRGEQANYVGLANQYQQSLVDQQVLESKPQRVTPMHVALIMHEQEPTFFGTSRITLTSMSEAKAISETLLASGIEEQLLVLKGWSADGLSFRQPYRMTIPDRSGLNNLSDYAQTQAFPIFLEQDYLVSSELSARINFNRDVSRNYSKLKMSYRLNRLDNEPIDEYYIYPKQSQAMLASDLGTIQGLAVNGLSFIHSGRNLFSYYDQNRVGRDQTKATLQAMMASLAETAMHRPFAYLFNNLDYYLDMPITNSQLDIYTDLIPLVPIVLKGYIPTFTPYLNFNALGKERLLQMIDFGINPSYILTEEPSSALRFTYSNRFYTTEFSDFKDDMIAVYDYVSSGLNPVLGAKVVARTMLQTGVSLVEYDSGVKIYINYRSAQVTTADGMIPGLDYKVVLP